MELPSTLKPGRRERHLRGRHQNPLVAWPLVAGTLHASALIGPDKMVRELLSAGEKESEAVLEMVDADQLPVLVARGGDLLDGLDREQVETVIPRERLALLEKRLWAQFLIRASLLCLDAVPDTSKAGWEHESRNPR